MTTAAARPALSFVVPVYDEEGNVRALHAELTEVARTIGRPYELLFVDDGSTDATLARLLEIADGDPALGVVELDGNFGEAAALSAGFAIARGDVIVTLDGDGQNDPADVPRLLAALGDGCDAVSGRRRRREERFTTRILPSWMANRLIVLATGVPVYDCGCGLKIYRRRLVEGAQLPRGFNRFLPAILGVDRSRVAEVEVRDRARTSGQSHYGLGRVAIVLRDLPVLPLVTRLRLSPRPLVRALAWLAAVLGLAGIAAMVVGRPGTAFLWLALAVLAWATRHNAARLARAREAGVFRVRRVHHGRTSAADRDRGRGLLGQEPAPELR